MTQETRRTLLIATLLGIIAALCWSGNWVLGRAIRGEVPPMGLTFWRWTLSALILAPFALRTWRSDWAALKTEIGILLALGLTGGASFQAMVYVGLARTEAVNALLLNTTAPIYVMALAAPLLGDPLRWRQVLGFALAVPGVIWVVIRGEPARLAALSFNAGDLWILAAMVIWGGYSVLLKMRRAPVTPVGLVFAISVLAALFILPAAVIETLQGRPMPINATAAAAVGYTGVFASVVALLAYNGAVQRIGPGRTIYFIYLMPVFGAVLARVFLGEALAGYHLIGFPLVLAGVVIATAK